MAERLLAWALLAGLSGAFGCGGPRANSPPVAAPDLEEGWSAPHTDVPVVAAAPPTPPPPPSSAPAPTVVVDATPAARPIPTSRPVSYPYPVATLPGFEMLPDGGSRLFVEVNRTVHVEERRAARVLTYILRGTRVVHRNNENILETVHFNTPVTSARLWPSGKDLTFTVDLRADAAPAWKIVPQGDGSATLQIDFPSGNYLPAGDIADVSYGGPRPDAAPPPPPPANEPRPARRAAAYRQSGVRLRGAAGVNAAPPPAASPGNAQPSPN
jgi:hypothetical protein